MEASHEPEDGSPVGEIDVMMPAEDELDDGFYVDMAGAGEDGSASTCTVEPKILHGSGVSRLKRMHTQTEHTTRRLTNLTAEDFIARTMAEDFNAAQALDMLQHRYTMDYGRRSAGSKPASTADEYYPTFHLDMVSIIGNPLQAIASRSSFFDNVTFTLQHWAAPYSSTHAISGLPFKLTNRTFRLATGASREIWFLVLHPIQREALELPVSHARGRPGSTPDSHRSALRRDHAEALSKHIRELFLDGALLGEGVEPCWTLGDRRSQNITFEKWAIFQELFMARWNIFLDMHTHDQFWANHQPAFHAYDHGANIPIQVNEAMEALPRATTLRADEYESESESGSDSGSETESAGDERKQQWCSRGRYRRDSVVRKRARGGHRRERVRGKIDTVERASTQRGTKWQGRREFAG